MEMMMMMMPKVMLPARGQTVCVIWRITQDGKPVNAILRSEEPINKFYVYAIRNSFGTDFDPLTGKLWIHKMVRSRGMK
jgi:glucose/arabinose dehydrogenase